MRRVCCILEKLNEPTAYTWYVLIKSSRQTSRLCNRKPQKMKPCASLLSPNQLNLEGPSLQAARVIVPTTVPRGENLTPSNKENCIDTYTPNLRNRNSGRILNDHHAQKLKWQVVHPCPLKQRGVATACNGVCTWWVLCVVVYEVCFVYAAVVAFPIWLRGQPPLP